MGDIKFIHTALSFKLNMYGMRRKRNASMMHYIFLEGDIFSSVYRGKISLSGKLPVRRAIRSAIRRQDADRFNTAGLISVSVCNYSTSN